MGENAKFSLRYYIILPVLVIIMAFMSACAGKEEKTEGKSAKDTADEMVESVPELIWSADHENELVCVAVSPDGTVAAGEDCAVYIHRISDGRLDDIYIYESIVEDIEFSRDGTILGAGFNVNGVLITDTLYGSTIRQLHDGFCGRLTFSPDGETIATGSSDGRIRIWNIRTGEQSAVLELPDNDWVTSLAYNPSGTHLAVSQWTDKGTVSIWDIGEGKIINTITLNNFLGNIKEPFQFSPDGTIMAGAIKEEYEHIVRLWTADGATQLADLSIPGGYRDMDFSYDGSLLAVASMKAVTIWDVSSRTLLYTLEQVFTDEETDSISEIAFTPDGRHVAVARMDGKLEMWRLPGAEQIKVAADDSAPGSDLLPSDMLFNVGSSQLKDGAALRLEAFARKLCYNYEKASVKFIGHTDSSGLAEENLKLSQERSNAVSNWFTEWAKKNGYDDWTFSAEGRGESELKVPDTDAQGAYIKDAASVNRRIEVVITGTERASQKQDGLTE